MISQETLEVLWRLKTTILALAETQEATGEKDSVAGLKLAAQLVQDEIDGNL